LAYLPKKGMSANNMPYAIEDVPSITLEAFDFIKKSKKSLRRYGMEPISIEKIIIK
jgi:hypothetical protein